MQRVGLFVGIQLLLSAMSFAQFSDYEMWLGTGIKQQVAKEWSWSVQWENRWNQGIRWHDQGLVDFAIERRLNKHWNVNGQLRVSERQEVFGGYLSRRRWAVRLNGDWNAGPGKLLIRMMLTEAYEPLTALDGINKDAWEPTTRLRLGYSWDWNDYWESGASWEVFRTATGAWSERWTTSIGRPLASSIDIEMGYLFGNEWYESDPWRSHTFRVKTTWTLQDWNPKKRPTLSVVWKDGERFRQPGEKDCAPCRIEMLRVSEVNSKNDAGDYIEIQNAGPAACSLKDWRITDDLSSAGFQFDEVILPESGCWLGYEGGRNSFDFGLSADGEVLYLMPPDGANTVELHLLPAREGLSLSFDESWVCRYIEPSPGWVETRK